MKNLSFLFCLVASITTFTGCDQTPKIEYIEVEALPVMDIFTAHDVAPYLEINSNKYETPSKWYATQSKELSASNPAKAIWNIKRAITLYPHASYYSQLITLLLGQNNYSELSECYELIQSMSEKKGGKQHGFSPLSEAELCDYVVYTYKGNGFYPFQLVSFMSSNQLNHKAFREKLTAYEPLQTQINTPEFKSFLASLLSDEEQQALEKSPELFQFLLSKCAVVQQINETKHSIAQFNFKNSDVLDMADNPLDYMCYNFFKERSESEHWCRIEPKEYVVLADSNMLLHYLVDTSMTGVTIDKRNIYHVLATFTAHGKPIDYLIAGKQCGDELYVFNYGNNTLNMEKFKRVWRFGNDYNRFDNEVTKEINAGTSSYTINPDGKFTKL